MPQDILYAINRAIKMVGDEMAWTGRFDGGNPVYTAISSATCQPIRYSSRTVGVEQDIVLIGTRHCFEQEF